MMFTPREWQYLRTRKDGLKAVVSHGKKWKKQQERKSSSMHWSDDKYNGRKAKKALSFHYWYESGSVQYAAAAGAQSKSRAQWKNGRLQRPAPS